jgi:hypothetical protein
VRTLRSIPICSVFTRASAAGGLFAAACVYSFSGGGLPPHIDTVAVLPFENQTTQFTLTQEIHQRLLDEMGARLGLRPAGEAAADAIVRGRILQYTNEPLVFRGGGERGDVVREDQRRVTVAISVELYDAVEDKILWQAGSLSATGEYRIDEGEQRGRQIAIENLVQKVIDGAQSQW